MNECARRTRRAFMNTEKMTRSIGMLTHRREVTAMPIWMLAVERQVASLERQVTVQEMHVVAGAEE
jgi:hypothetical protein